MFKVIGGIKKIESSSDELAKQNISPLTFLSYLTFEKKNWEKLNEVEKKQFSPFIILKWLSMSQELTPYISLIIKYTIGVLDSQQIYMFLYFLLPKKKFYFNYVKKNKEEKYNKVLIDIFIREFELSRREITDYLDFYKSNKSFLQKTISKYGMNEKEIEKLLKELK